MQCQNTHALPEAKGLRQILLALRRRIALWALKDEPLLWTIKGNLPQACLQMQTRWERTDDYVKFTEAFLLDGELVRESHHALALRAPGMTGDQAKFG